MAAKPKETPLVKNPDFERVTKILEENPWPQLHPNATTAEEMISKEAHDKICERLLKYTGKVFSLIYRPHNGFANYAVIQLELKDGVVEKVLKLTEPAAAFEARAKMEMLGGYELEEMRRKYPAEFRHG